MRSFNGKVWMFAIAVALCLGAGIHSARAGNSNLVVHEVNNQPTFNSGANPAALQPGDYIVFNTQLLDANNNPVGHDLGQCIFTRAAGAASTAAPSVAYCTASFVIDGRGQIATVGEIDFTGSQPFNPGGPFASGVLAVTGGTGEFETARGQVAVQFLDPQLDASFSFDLDR